MSMEYFSLSTAKTQDMAKGLAQDILRGKMSSQGAVVLGLEGELGSGKTTFVQGFAKGLGIKENITSPTFVLMKRFEVVDSVNQKFENLYHFDCYRLKGSEEILGLGFEGIIKDPKNIVVIEWADRIKTILPPDTTHIHFETKTPTDRKIILK